MKKKFLAAGLAAAMMLSLAACGGNDTQGGGTADSGTEEHERADNRTADFPLHAVAFHQGFLTRNVSLQLVFSQHVLDLENFVIKYFQGEPMLNGMCFYVQRKAMLPGL